MTVLLAQLVIRATAFLPERLCVRWWVMDGVAHLAHRRIA